MKTFKLLRNEDASGISGTGFVAEGIEFTSGECAMSWLTEHRSIAIYPNMATLVNIHGHGGRTQVIYDEPCGYGAGV
jgi:hypothetical protein